MTTAVQFDHFLFLLLLGRWGPGPWLDSFLAQSHDGCQQEMALLLSMRSASDQRGESGKPHPMEATGVSSEGPIRALSPTSPPSRFGRLRVGT